MPEKEIDTTIVSSTLKIADKETTIATSTLAQNFETATEHPTTAFVVSDLEPETDQGTTQRATTVESFTALIESGTGLMTFKNDQISMISKQSLSRSQ